MGFLKRIFGGRTDQTPSPHVPPGYSQANDISQSPTGVELSVSMGEQTLVQLTGTTTFAKEAVTDLALRHGIEGDGYFEGTGTLQREPENKADPLAVAVLVEGERIGYLPGYLARGQAISVDGARAVPVQIFFEMLPKGPRAEAWAWLGNGTAQWQWSELDRPPMSSGAKAAARHRETHDIVNEALAEGGARATSFKAGMVKGVHYLQLVEPIKQLKREGRLEEALALCSAAIEGAERGREGREPAPWYTEQAAIIHRKLGQHDEEIAVLRRWLKICPSNRREGSRIKARLDKLLP
ncbi:hypothetical protein [Paeniglutamicibacter psychrophenolicus]|uniref:hypothetical protein n=1 Tax=Paeniglutamicibacter psychrophenolicus TaxID=257454 RepID=UPI0027805552|nr:hypothetical protein [Paeniglutamicibacter psychrophenolicus]MDQ0092476.1 hypothetical protein [Paeniglutamicibacter psychrophenolicus]